MSKSEIVERWVHALAMTDARLLQRPTQWLARKMYPFPKSTRVVPVTWFGADAHPQTTLTVLTEATVSAHTSAVFHAGNVYMEKVPESQLRLANYAAPPIITHGRRFAFVAPPAATRRISLAAFSLLGNGSFNYYHWLIELLPRLQHLPEALEQFPQLVILAPRSVAETRQLREALELLTPPGIEVLYVGPEEAVTVETLLIPRHASLSVFNKRANHRFAASDFHFDPDSISWLREHLLARINTGPSLTGKRLLLARHEGRRSYNQDEMIELFTPYGFESIYLEDLSLREQAAALAGAEAIAGPTGAAWSNLIFCKRGATAFYWVAEEFGDFVPFDDLARSSGVDFIKMTFPTGARATASLYQRPSVVPITRARETFDEGLRRLS